MFIKTDNSSSIKTKTDRQRDSETDRETDYLSPIDQLPLSIVSFLENLQKGIRLPKCVLNRSKAVPFIILH